MLTPAYLPTPLTEITQARTFTTLQLKCKTWCPGKFTLVVCNYFPAGNYIGSSVYEKGSACSRDSECTTYSSSACDTISGLCFHN
uniref:SCP domain-containing protein n=1 Tax=Ditylenchus dipsaci TaxID=166011 RepID=A0A915EP88_9BILA